MSLHKEDSRSKKIIFVANCLLNANNKVLEFARYAGMFKQIVDVIAAYDMGIIQMPCPEVLYMGNARWWHSSNLYDNVGYRRFCRKLSVQMADYIENYNRIGYDVVAVLTCDGSPSCGITKSSYCQDWGGRPKEVPRTLIDKPGIYMQELQLEIESRNLCMPYVYGLMMDDLTKTNQQIIDAFNDFAAEKIAACKDENI